jgi:hypothetical protein
MDWLCRSYIRPDGKTWLKFDDDRVSREEERTATEAQFGACQALAGGGAGSGEGVRRRGAQQTRARRGSWAG